MKGTEYHQERKYIIQPSCVPVEISLSEDISEFKKELHDKNCHGLIIKNKEKIDIDKLVNIKINIEHLIFEGKAIVSFCRKIKSGFEIGVEFISSCDPFEVKMTLQVCQIKEFLESKQNQNCVENEKALGWIKLNASSF